MKTGTGRMMENDFLRPILCLNPIAVASIIWFWGFGSLALIAMKTDTVTSILLKHPGFMVGDFFLLPITGLLVAYFYQHSGPAESMVTSRLWTIGGAAVATILTVVSIVRNDLINIWFVPHGIFYWFMAYMLVTFLPKALIHLIMTVDEKRLWFAWFATLLAISCHLVLPVIFGPKILPKP